MRTIIVTGAGRGIGAAIAQHFATLGDTVFAVDLEHAELEQNAAIKHCVVDVTDPDAVEGLVQKVLSETSRLDVLVNNAGIRVVGDVVNTSVDDWDRLMSVNLKAVFLLSKFALPPMIAAGKGSVVNIASMAASNPMWDRAAYCASKAGVIGLTKQMALQYARLGVRVNAVCPGPTLTPFMEYQFSQFDEPESVQDAYADRQPMGQLADPSHIAHAVAYLASDGAGVVTGTTVDVDCGTSLLNGQGASGRLAY